jgi:hypothetical protein
MVTKATKKRAVPKLPGKGPHPLYGRPIDAAIRRGDIAEMRRVSTQARKYLRDVQTALEALDRKLGKAR